MEIKISVIIPIGNMEENLGACLDSVVKQTLKEIEIICVNYGVEDETKAIVRKYMEKDPRIVLTSQKFMGITHALNYSMENAKGKYVAFMTPDGKYPDRDVLRILYDKVKESAAFICGGSYCENRDEKSAIQIDDKKKKNVFEKDIIMKYSDYQMDIGYQSFIYNLEFLKENNISFPPYSCLWDSLFFVTAMITAGKFYAIRKPTYCACGKNTDKTMGKEELIDFLKGLSDLLRISSQHQLTELHCQVLRRLVVDSEEIFGSALINADSPELIKMLQEVEQEINPTLIRKEQGLIPTSELVYHLLKAGARDFRDNKLVSRMQQQIEAISKENNWLKDKVYGEECHENVEMLGQSPKVSVIIPIYNVEEYIQECLESVKHQTLKDIEIILVNDGSTDRSTDIIKKDILDDARIKVLRKENGGLSSARNAGMKIATGEYIIFLDSDDYLDENALRIMYTKAKNEKLDDLFYNAESFFEDEETKKDNENYGNYYKRTGNYGEGVCSGQVLFMELSSNGDYKPSACLQLLNREFLEKENITFYEGILHEDSLFTIQCFLKAQRVSFLDIAFYKRRVRKNSIMTIQKGVRNSYGYFVGIWQTIKIVEEYQGSFTPGFIHVLEDQLRKMSDAASEYIKGISERELNNFIHTLPAEEQLAYPILIFKLAALKQQLRDEKAAEEEQSRITSQLLMTINEMKKIPNEKWEKEKKDLEKERAELLIKNQKLKNSSSYRIGRAITFLPRVIKKFLA